MFIIVMEDVNREYCTNDLFNNIEKKIYILIANLNDFILGN